MIAYIHGKLLEATDKSCIILTPGGVGYELFLTISAISTLPESGSDVTFYVHSVIREDAFDLYGFPCFDDREVSEPLFQLTALVPKGAGDPFPVRSQGFAGSRFPRGCEDSLHRARYRAQVRTPDSLVPQGQDGTLNPPLYAAEPVQWKVTAVNFSMPFPACAISATQMMKCAIPQGYL